MPISELSAKWEKSDEKERPSKSPKPPKEDKEESVEPVGGPTIEQVEEQENEEPVPQNDVTAGEEIQAPEYLPGLFKKHNVNKNKIKLGGDQ